MKNISQDSLCRDRDSKREVSEYKSEALKPGKVARSHGMIF
jgi:hypothetical protein